MQGIRNRRQSGRLSINAAKGQAAITGVLAPPARAGHYAVTYSVTDPAILDPANAQMQTTYALSSSGFGVSVETSGYSASATANSAITATFNWTHDGDSDTSLPPQEVLIAETSTVNASASVSTGSAGGSVDDGLGQHDVPTGPRPTSFQAGPTTLYQYSQNCSGNRYTIQTGSTFTVTCTPSANANCGNSSVQVSVSYSATVTVPALTLTGVTSGSGGAPQILVGQALTSTLSAGSFTLLGYSWSVTGGLPFYYWTANQYMTNYADLSIEDNTQSSYLAYFGKSDTATIKGSATVTFPDGTSSIISLQANVGVIAPTDASRFDPPGTVTIGASANGSSSITTVPAPDDNSAIQWVGNLSLPSPFAGQGNWTIAQTILNERYYTPFQGARTPQGPGTNVVGCDTSFPYIPGSHPTDGLGYDNGDSPAYALDMSGKTQKQEIATETFKTWILYLPPNSGAGNSMYVPIHVFNWSWQGAAVYTKANPYGLTVGWDFPRHAESGDRSRFRFVHD